MEMSPPPPPSSVCRSALQCDKHKQQQGDVVLLAAEGRAGRRVSACWDDSPHAKARNAHAHVFTANGPGPSQSHLVRRVRRSRPLQRIPHHPESREASRSCFSPSSKCRFYGAVGGEAPVGTECGRKEAKSDANLHQSGLFHWLDQGTANGGIQRKDQMTLLFNMKSSFPGCHQRRIKREKNERTSLLKNHVVSK